MTVVCFPTNLWKPLETLVQKVLHSKKKHKQISAAMQQVFEEKANQILIKLHERTGHTNLVVSGGCFMNSVYNGKIEKQTPFKHCYITSCPDDSGTSIGAALYLYQQRTNKNIKAYQNHNFWGEEFSDKECLESVKKFKLSHYSVEEDPGKKAAEDIAHGKLIAWFQGRSEFGQRALGNRSIIADPRKAETKDIINSAVKFRESFRPFAPAILKEYIGEYFETESITEVPFMEKVLQFKADKTLKVPAVVHDDGSGRLQTVNSKSSPRYYDLISSFHEITGIPMVVNTSFNLNGEPMVNSPEDAIRTFFTCGLDILYLGNIRITK